MSLDDLCYKWRWRESSDPEIPFAVWLLFEDVTPAPDPHWLRSIPTTAFAEQLAREHYGLDDARAVLVRMFVNDVFRVDTGGDSYALKVYGAERWAADEVRWEQALAQHVVAAGVPVSAPVALAVGDTVGVVAAPEGERPFALTRWIPGSPPRYPFSDELYATFGITLARFHQATVDFVTDLPRRSARTDEQVEQIVTALQTTRGLRERADAAARARLVRDCAVAAEQKITELERSGLRHGICHGDASMDNLHVTPDGVGLYDLDLAGPGWLVRDLAGALSTDHAEAFLAGYTSIQPLSPADLEAVPWLRILAWIENLHFHVVRKPATFGVATLGEGWVDDGFTDLAELAHSVGVRSAG